MIIFIIAGGSGTRLWPLSTHKYPKHLLSLTHEYSLLQSALKRARKLSGDDKIFVITEASHSHHVKEQLSDLPLGNILVEPARRGTAGCVLYAMQHIERLSLAEDEPVALLWADHLIRDEGGFVESFKRAGILSKKHKKAIFIGAEPTYPATGFGYMERGERFDSEETVYELVRFHEKPDSEAAKKYLKSGRFLWNMGYIVLTSSVFKSLAQEFSPDFYDSYNKLLNSANLDKAYLDLENIALEYVFTEKIHGALVMPGTFDWVDVGSFKDLHEISEQDTTGNHIRGENIEIDSSTNCYVQNQTDLPVAVIGVDNVVVVTTPNGILVTNKNYAQKVGDIAKKLQS